MAITFSGEFTSLRTPNEVYDFLSDPNKFAPLLPDFESMTVQDATHFTVKVRVGVGNIRGSAEIKMELAEASCPLRALYRGQGTAVGSQIKISAGFDLSPIAEGTKIAWQGEAGVFGKLASMAGGMLEPLGKKNIQKLIDGLKWALTWPTAQVVAQQTPSEVSQRTLAEQLAPSGPQEAPSEVSQGDSQLTPSKVSQGLEDSPPTESAAQESHGTEVGPTAADARQAAEQSPNDANSSPQGGTNVAQDVSPGSA